MCVEKRLRSGQEGIDHSDAAVVLTVVKVFGEQFSGSAGLGGGQDLRVPKRDLPATLQIKSQTKHAQRIVYDRPAREVVNQCHGIGRGMSGSNEIDIKLLQYLHADRGATWMEPSLL